MRKMLFISAAALLTVGLLASAPITFANGGLPYCIVNFDYYTGPDPVPGTIGNDFIDCRGSPVGHTIDGNLGDDLIFGSEYDDVINAAAGNDEIYGNGGKDVLRAGFGNDTVYGGDGEDILEGGAGDDTMDGGAGADMLSGGLDNDTLYGGAGEPDICAGGKGNDTPAVPGPAQGCEVVSK